MVTREIRASRRETSWDAVAGITATVVTTLLFLLYAVAAQSPTDRTPLVFFLGLLTLTGPSIAVAAYVRARRARRADVGHAVGQVLLVWACPALIMTIVLGLATLVT